MQGGKGHQSLQILQVRDAPESPVMGWAIAMGWAIERVPRESLRGCLRAPLRMRACRCKACPFCQARLADSANQMRQARKSGKMRRRGMKKKQEQSESTVTVTVNTPAPTTPRKRRKRRKGAPEAAAPAA